MGSIGAAEDHNLAERGAVPAPGGPPDRDAGGGPPGEGDAAGGEGEDVAEGPASGEDRREIRALIEATWAVAARIGTIEPSVREILEEAGLSTKTFYRHFRSKDDLLLVAYDEGTQLMVEYLEHRMSAVDEPFGRIAAWIEGFVRQASPPTARRVLPWSVGIGRMALDFPDDYERNQTALVAPLAREIARTVRSGTGHSPDPAGDAMLVFGYAEHAVRRHLIQGRALEPSTVDELVSFAYRALGREPGGA